MYEKGRSIISCHIAGFTHYDGLELIDKLKLGTVVTLAAEPENPYDPEAVLVLYNNTKLGYIPKTKNEFLSLLLYFGFSDIVEAKINKINLQEYPDIGIIVKLKDRRKNSD